MSEAESKIMKKYPRYCNKTVEVHILTIEGGVPIVVCL